jgi:hypothetical protein
MSLDPDDIDEKIRSHRLWLRQKPGGLRADFSNADMKGCELVDIILVRAKLLGANVSCSKLNGINLSESDLYSADFSYSDLLGANLSLADMRGMKLREANLTGANLEGTDLTGTRHAGRAAARAPQPRTRWPGAFSDRKASGNAAGRAGRGQHQTRSAPAFRVARRDPCAPGEFIDRADYRS